MKTLTVNLGENSYNIYVGCGLLKDASRLFDLNRRVLIVTDDGVPKEYSKILAAQCASSVVMTLPQGEKSKTLDSIALLLRQMMAHGFDRKDCVVAVGGGVIGDLSGFAASCYMRGIDFYNIPTTVLSQVDSSVGGKTGVNLDGIKNIVGAFKQPKGVIADRELLSTLPRRQISNGLSEAVKMAMTFDSSLFELFEKKNADECLEEIISKSIAIKISVVEKDEKEAGLRKVLNFGHTVGHGIESLGLGYYHGECVALGMLPMCSEGVRERLIKVLEKLGLPTDASFDREAALSAISHDKKSSNGKVSAVFVKNIGSFDIKSTSAEELKALIYNSFPNS